MNIIANYITFKILKELSTYYVKFNAFESVCLLSNRDGQWLKSDWSCHSVLLGCRGAHIGLRRCVLTGRFLTRMELREELREANFLLLTFVLLSVPLHFPQSRPVCITSSTSDCWRVVDPSSPLTYSHGLNIQACRLWENPSHPSWEMMITNSRASPTWWTWVWVGSGSWWWTGKPGVLQSMESQRVGHDWETELNWTEF